MSYTIGLRIINNFIFYGVGASRRASRRPPRNSAVCDASIEVMKAYRLRRSNNQTAPSGTPSPPAVHVVLSSRDEQQRVLKAARNYSIQLFRGTFAHEDRTAPPNKHSTHCAP